MTPPVFELAKVAAFAAAIGLVLSFWFAPLACATVAVVTLWLLLARIT